MCGYRGRPGGRTAQGEMLPDREPTPAEVHAQRGEAPPTRTGRQSRCEQAEGQGRWPRQVDGARLAGEAAVHGQNEAGAGRATGVSTFQCRQASSRRGRVRTCVYDRRGVPCNFIFGLLVVVRRRIRKVQSLATVGGRWVHHASSRSAFLKL